MPKTLDSVMLAEWDERIKNDYLNWMNEPVANDEELWQSGTRDFEQVFKGVDEDKLSGTVILDLGCGVGRLMRPAAKLAQKVIGVDISAEALSIGKTLLEDLSNIELVKCENTDFSSLENESCDYLYSFGVLSNVPVITFSEYLIEISRLLKIGGQARLQLFIGKCLPTVKEDTAAYRSFAEKDLRAGMEKAGLEVEDIYDLDVGVEVPDDGWLKPVICVAVRVSEPSADADKIEQALLPGGEPSAPADWPGSAVAYGLHVGRAIELLKAKRNAEALSALKLAVENYSQPEKEVLDLITKLET